MTDLSPSVLAGTAAEWSGAAHLQTKWDWRAVANFIGGGTGAGLLTAALLVAPAPPPAFRLLFGLGLAVIALGLLCIMAKLGRPGRALNVFRHVETSWMTREGLAMPTLFGGGLIALWQGGVGVMAFLAMVSAWFFLYCQARILRAAKGIPAWSAPAVVPLVMATGLAEGLGLAALVSPLTGSTPPVLAIALLAALLLRYAAWRHYRAGLAATGAPMESRRVLEDFSGNFTVSGHGLPMLLLVLALVLGEPATTGLAATAGLLASLAGWLLKSTLLTRAAFFYKKTVSIAAARAFTRQGR
jgi:phenylacetyl-CoA:acceptor oxidoreductase subunit 2